MIMYYIKLIWTAYVGGPWSSGMLKGQLGEINNRGAKDEEI